MVLVFFLELVIGRSLEPSSFFFVSPKSQFFCHSCVTFFYVAAIFQKDFFKQFLHLTIKQKLFNPYFGDLFFMKIMMSTNKPSVAHFISFALTW